MFGLFIHQPPYSRRGWTVYRVMPDFLPDSYVFRPICKVIR